MIKKIVIMKQEQDSKKVKNGQTARYGMKS